MAGKADAAFDYASTLQARAQGRPDALRALYEQEAARLVGIAHRILRRRDLAEDVVHEVFVQIWRDAARFNPERGSGRAWLGTILRNRALNVVRQQARLGVLDESGLHAVPDHADDPAAALERLEEGEALKKCLGELEPVRRRCILLAYVDGLTQSEIADTLSVPLNTAKSWVRRSLLSLRECLQ